MVTMEELLASQTKKLITLFRGQQVEGEVIYTSDKEITLDLGAKSEGILQKKEINQDVKLGDKIKVFVSLPENESGQAVVSTNPISKQAASRGKGISWDKFIQAQNQKTKLSATVVEVNKGGLIVEVEGVRGFLPNSQVGFELLSKSGQGMESLIGQTLSLTVIEVDQGNNKLIFTQRGQVSDEARQKLKEFKVGTKAQGKIVAVLPFGLVVNIAGSEGLVFISDVAWEKVEDLTQLFKVGQEIKVVVTGIDEDLGRLNLSIKQLTEDPFAKLVDKYPADEVVKGEVVSVTEAGVVFKLEEGVEGLLPAAKMEPGANYEVGKSMNVLVDSVDLQRRKILLAPFVTSTEGLIYK